MIAYGVCFRIDDVEAKADSIHEIEEFGNATTAGEVHAEEANKSFTQNQFL